MEIFILIGKVWNGMPLIILIVEMCGMAVIYILLMIIFLVLKNGINPIKPPYDFIIDMKNIYNVKSVDLMAVNHRTWDNTPYGWLQRIKDYEYWIADGELSQSPTLDDFNSLEWKKIGEDICPVRTREYRTVETSEQFVGSLLKIAN